MKDHVITIKVEATISYVSSHNNEEAALEDGEEVFLVIWEEELKNFTDVTHSIEVTPI